MRRKEVQLITFLQKAARFSFCKTFNGLCSPKPKGILFSILGVVVLSSKYILKQFYYILYSFAKLETVNKVFFSGIFVFIFIINS